MLIIDLTRYKGIVVLGLRLLLSLLLLILFWREANRVLAAELTLFLGIGP